jgi:hypothetical protein
MNKDWYSFKNKRNTSTDFFNTQKDKERQKIGQYVPKEIRKIVSAEEKIAHFKFGIIYLTLFHPYISV